MNHYALIVKKGGIKMVKTIKDLQKEIVKLKVNYKTLEEFKKFKEYGIQELSMSEDLEANIIENDSESPFYGIYFSDKLVARMSVYQVSGKYNRYFEPPVDYLEIWKLEVLLEYQGQGYGTALVKFRKGVWICRLKQIHVSNQEVSGRKWVLIPLTMNMDRDLGENPLIWLSRTALTEGNPNKYY